VIIWAEAVTPAGLLSKLSCPLLELWEMILAGPVLVKLMARGGLVDPGGALATYTLPAGRAAAVAAAWPPAVAEPRAAAPSVAAPPEMLEVMVTRLPGLPEFEVIVARGWDVMTRGVVPFAAPPGVAAEIALMV
jgi:hypothetical protein